MKTKRVDIIIPVYNVEPYLRRCLNSVLKQTFKHWRAICVDDGSTDGCPAILEEYAANDSRFMVIHQANGGLSHARNEGMAVADAEYIMFVDSDDFIHPQTLELAVKLMERDGTDMVSWYKDVVYKNIQLRLFNKYNIDTVNSRPWRMSFRYKLSFVRSVVTDDALKFASDWRHPDIKFPIKHCYVWRHLFKRSLIKDIPFIKGLKFEDLPWWSELLVKPVKTTITHLPLYYYYENRKSISKATEGVERLQSQLIGLSHAQEKYEKYGDAERMALWSHNIKWAILSGSSRVLYKMPVGEETDRLVQHITELVKKGFFDDATKTIELKAKDAYYAVANGKKLSL